MLLICLSATLVRILGLNAILFSGILAPVLFNIVSRFLGLPILTLTIFDLLVWMLLYGMLIVFFFG